MDHDTKLMLSSKIRRCLSGCPWASHRDGCVGMCGCGCAFVPAAKDPLREGRPQGGWKFMNTNLLIQDTSSFIDSFCSSPLEIVMVK